MLGVLWEWRCLAVGISGSPSARGLLNFAGIVYVGFAAFTLVTMRMGPNGMVAVLQVVSAVIATDVGAYFAGRTFGGPKIAPKVSPSKTWSGLAGGMMAAGSLLAIWEIVVSQPMAGYMAASPAAAAMGGAIVAVVAQTGDFFESWMKRRAGVKDSSHLIPGHGGLFDRVDGLLAVSFVLGIFLLFSGGLAAIR